MLQETYSKFYSFWFETAVNPVVNPEVGMSIKDLLKAFSYIYLRFLL